MDDPDTWKNYEADLRAADLSQVEIMRLVDATFDANSLNEDKIDEARESFLASITQVEKAE